MNTTQTHNTDGPVLLAALEDFLTRYAALPDGMPLVLALYVAMTHCFEIFDALPYLTLNSPTKGCGKTRVLELLSFLSKEPISTVGITPAALFRIIQAKKPTLLVDESETLSARTDKAEALREIANAGYKKGQLILRCDERQRKKGDKGGQYTVKQFDVFGPKVFALIGKLPPTLADRSIEIRMQRSGKRLARYRRALVEPEGHVHREKLSAWIGANKDAIKAWYESNDVPFLEGRNEELWLSLFAICNVMAPDRAEELKDIALESVGAKTDHEQDDTSLRLLADIRDFFGSKGTAEISTADLCKGLNEIPEAAYSTWNNKTGFAAGIMPNDLARRLHPFGVRSHNLRFGASVNKGYRRQDFESAWESYLPKGVPSSRYSRYTLENTGDNSNIAPATERSCSGSEMALNPNPFSDVARVAAKYTPLSNAASPALEGVAIGGSQRCQ